MALHLEMDLERQEIANLEELKANPTAWGLANAVAAESGQEEWNQLRRIYWELKQYWTEHSDLEQVEVSFPPEVLAGTMVAYFDIFPFAKRQSLLRRLCGRGLKTQTIQSPTPKIGRNDPCPCGSGKKWKRCCGA